IASAVSYGRLFILLIAAGCRPDTLISPPRHDLGPGDDLAQANNPSAPPDLAGPAASPDLGSSGPAVTLIRIHYPDSGHTLSLRGDTAPLDWQKGLTLTAAPDKTTFTYELQSPA